VEAESGRSGSTSIRSCEVILDEPETFVALRLLYTYVMRRGWL